MSDDIDLNAFIASDFVPEEGGFDPVPEGEYVVEHEDGKVKDTKAKNGKYFEARLRIKGPSFVNRVVYARFNIANPNPRAQSIGQTELFRYAKAQGFERPGSADAFLGRQCLAVIIVSDDGKNNEVKRFKPLGDGPAKAATTSAPKPSAPSVKGEALPWE
jgi:hypothetical protein